MSEFFIISVILLMFIVFLLSGLYIHSVLFACGIIGLILLEGFSILPGLLGNEPFNRAASYTLTTIPLFVLMAQFVLQSGIVQDMFYFINRLSKGNNSLLGALTIIIGGLLGAVSGSGTATAASLGQVAVPELTKHGYKPELAAAVAASGGSLSGIVPPSIILILYGVATETPVGDLFMAAVIPSILVMIVFIIVMLACFYVFRKKTSEAAGLEPERKGPPQQAELPAMRLVVVNAVGLIIVIVIFGGIYSGVFTPTEAGAVGAFTALLSTLVLGKVNIAFFTRALTETIKVTGMVMLILIGAQIFGRFVSLSLLPRKLINLLDPIMEYPVIVLIVITIALFIMFMFIEGAAVILMSIPVIMPIIQAIGVDVLWFGIFISVICTVGLITPPVGLSVYAVSGASKMTPEPIFRYTMLFAFVATVVVGGIMIAFPDLVLWIPDSME
ncbi:TRAP transporter large permease [Alteribacillus sp. JSM 102045]|uniref:TRAP transporter large permease n=1 Tax=Alteribacillus sp. JSM 102045 TaxID=1562101 RepID=UPI0035C132B7